MDKLIEGREALKRCGIKVVKSRSVASQVKQAGLTIAHRYKCGKGERVLVQWPTGKGEVPLGAIKAVAARLRENAENAIISGGTPYFIGWPKYGVDEQAKPEDRTTIKSIEAAIAKTKRIKQLKGKILSGAPLDHSLLMTSVSKQFLRDLIIMADELEESSRRAHAQANWLKRSIPSEKLA